MGYDNKSDAEAMPSRCDVDASKHWEEFALSLINKQRAVVVGLDVGSAAHRGSSDLLAALEESHFVLHETHALLLETREMIDRLKRREPATVVPPAATPRSEKSSFKHAMLVALLFVVAFSAAVVAIEVIDPMPLGARALSVGPAAHVVPSRAYH